MQLYFQPTRGKERQLQLIDKLIHHDTDYETLRENQSVNDRQKQVRNLYFTQHIIYAQIL